MKVQVKTITEKEGNKPWKFGLSDGNEYSTFSPDVRSGLAEGMWIEAVVEVKKTVKGGQTYENHYLNEWKSIETPKAGEAPPDMSEAKDRAIAMESAYKAAAEALKAITPDKVTAALLQSTAYLIYRDIQKARAGESFEPKEPKRE